MLKILRRDVIEKKVSIPRLKAKRRPPQQQARSKSVYNPSNPYLAGCCWLERQGKVYLGLERVTLLEKIEELGSLNAAARSMQMGYRRAWELVNQMNSLSPKPLVIKAVGGRKGGGSQLTHEGKAAVSEFWRIVENFQKWIEIQNLYLKQT